MDNKVQWDGELMLSLGRSNARFKNILFFDAISEFWLHEDSRSGSGREIEAYKSYRQGLLNDAEKEPLVRWHIRNIIVLILRKISEWNQLYI